MVGAAIFILVFGILNGFMGVAGGIADGSADGAPGAATVALWLLLVLGGFVAVVATAAILGHRSWGRWLGIAVAGLGVVPWVQYAMAGLEPPLEVADVAYGALIAGLHVVAIGILLTARDHFQTMPSRPDPG